MSYRYKPSQAARKEFAIKMKEINDFCEKNGISKSTNNDSYYFSLNGKDYRVSNHSIEASNMGAFDEFTGEKKRELYHESYRRDDITYIHASKTRIIEIYTALKDGKKLNGRGEEINDSKRNANTLPKSKRHNDPVR